MEKIAYCFGTRPEIIKLSKLIVKSKSLFDVKTIFTGQHKSLFNDVSHLIEDPDYFIPADGKSLSQLASFLFIELEKILNEIKPDLLIVHGDTLSAYVAANVAFYMNIKVGHVEAGLRSFNLKSPFPEEFHRISIDKISTYCWCPTKTACNNLRHAGVDESKIYLTGNTIVDVINDIRIDKKTSLIPIPSDYIVLTLHRRENESKFLNILKQVNDYAKDNIIIFPVHPNPIIKNKIEGNAGNIKIIDPMKYEDFINLIAGCKFIISDSGGIQEEAVVLKKKVLVCRDNTERPEGVEIGICKIVGDNIVNNFAWAMEEVDFCFSNPYGSGQACDKILETLK